MFDPVKIGVVGLGTFGLLHAATVAGIAEAELVALVEPNAARRKAAQMAHAGVEMWSDLAAAIDQSPAQGWIVATSTQSHVAVTRQLLAAGKTVLLEKPIATTRAEAETLGSLVHGDSSNLMMGHVALFASEYGHLLDEVDKRGRPIYLDFVRHRPRMLRARFADESPFELLMIHDLYLVQAVMGGIEPRDVDARCRWDNQDRCELALAEMTWDDGCVARFTASLLTTRGMPEDGYDRIEVFGTEWAARIQANPRPITVWDEQAHWPMTLEIRTGDHPSGMLAEQLRSFCRVLRGVELVRRGARYEDAMQVMNWIDQFQTCAAAKQTKAN